jgi:hypothetical protein
MSHSNKDLNQNYETLHKLVKKLYARWKFTKGVYGHPKTLDGMNKVSPIGFGLIQESLFADIITSLCAATDPPEMGRNKNLSVYRLMDEVEHISNTEQVKHLKKLRCDLEKAIAPVKEHRNKLIGHFDLETLTVTQPNTLEINEIEKALKVLADALSMVYCILNDGRDIAYMLTSPMNAVGEFQWLVSDTLRFRMLMDQAKNPKVSCEVLRRMVANRSDRNDPPGPTQPYFEEDEHLDSN